MTIRRSVQIWLVVVVACVSTFGCRGNSSSTAAASDIPKLEFEKYTLANGLDVILRQDARLPVVAVDL